MVNAAMGAVVATGQLDAESRGRVSVAALTAYAASMIHPIVPGFLREFPEEDVQLVFTNDEVDPARDGLHLVTRPMRTPPGSTLSRPWNTQSGSGRRDLSAKALVLRPIMLARNVRASR